jgi:hypothetical protein
VRGLGRRVMRVRGLTGRSLWFPVPRRCKVVSRGEEEHFSYSFRFLGEAKWGQAWSSS